MRLAFAAVAGCPQYNQVAHTGHCAQNEGDYDPDFRCGGESGQLERVSSSALIAHWGGSLAAAIHCRICQLVEHNEHRSLTDGEGKYSHASMPDTSR